MDSKNVIYSDVGPEDVMKNSCYGQITSGNAADVVKVNNSCYEPATKSADRVSNACSKIALVILYIIVIALLLALVGACIAFTMEISSVKSETASASSLQGSQIALVSMIEDLMQQCLELKTAVVITATQSNESYSAYLQLNHTIQQLRVQLSQGFSAIAFSCLISRLSVSIRLQLSQMKVTQLTCS